MLYWLGEKLELEFLTSPAFLSALGALLAAGLTWVFLPKLWGAKIIPPDHIKQFVADGAKNPGKPTGTGLIFIPIFALVCLLVVPTRLVFLETLACVVFAMLSGFLDDASKEPWHEYKKAAIDFVIVLLAALAFCQLKHVEWWFPFIRETVKVPVILFVPLAMGLLWFAINATNCTDGVDNLAGSLCGLAFLCLGGLLAVVVGYEKMADSLHVPYHKAAVGWAIMAFTMTGTLAAYLWYNANPSIILMGDAGSRALGLLLGLVVLATGNPFIILAVATMILVDGGLGLFKVALKRFFNIEFLWNIRFPLHDHMKQTLEAKWSNPQVLVRFVLIQAMLAPLLLLLLLALR